jgi:predicted alpha/beta hydrolase
VIIGHSLGGQLAALYAGQSAPSLAGLVLVGACTPYHRAFGALTGPLMLAGATLAAVVARAGGAFPGRYVRFGSTEAPTLIADWATTVRTGRYHVRGARADYERSFAAVDIPTLALSIDGDRYAPRRSVDHLVEKMPRARVTRRHLDAGDLESPALDHFRWARNPRSMVSVIEAWLGVQGF